MFTKHNPKRKVKYQARFNRFTYYTGLVKQKSENQTTNKVRIGITIMIINGLVE